MRRAGLGLAGAASAFWGFLLLLGSFAEGEGRWLGAGVILLTLATLYAWRRPRPGGWALLVGGLAFGLVVASLAGRRPLLVFALAALPYTTPPWLAPGWGPRKGPPVGVISLGLRERNKRKGYYLLAGACLVASFQKKGKF